MSDIMNPPWIEFPNYEKGCAGWRMGPGEDYIYAYSDFISKMKEQEKKDYFLRFPPPKEWM